MKAAPVNVWSVLPKDFASGLEIAPGHDAGGEENDAADDGDLGVFDFEFLGGLARAGFGNRGDSFYGDGDEKDAADQDAGELGWEGGEAEAILQDNDGEEAQHGAVNRAAAAKNGGAAEDHGGDCRQFKAGAGVGFGLAEVGDINNRGDASEEAGEGVDEE